MGCALLIRCLPRSLRRIRVTRSGSGRNRARPSHPSHSVGVGPSPDLRPGPVHPSRRTRWGERRRGAERRPESRSVSCPLPSAHRIGVACPRLPAFLVGTPGPAPGSVPALAALSPSVSSPCSGGLPPGPDHGAGPPTVRPGIPKRPTRGRYTTRWALASVGRPSPPAASDGLRPGVRRAACAGQRPADIGRGDWRGQLAAHRPAANTRCWLTVTGRWSNQPSVPRAGSRALSRAGRPCPGLAHRPPVAPAVSTRCQFRAGA